MIKLIVGLGNPGQEYEKTRHNAGFLFLDHLMSSQGEIWSKSSQFQGEVGFISDGIGRLELLKPMAYMNKSGLSVGMMLRYYKLKPEELLVVHDELELAEAAVRLKRNGGHAGHNGLRDIISHIDSRDFYRLRLGIGRPLSGSSVADYVLSKPSGQMLSRLSKAFCEIEAHLALLLAGDVDGFNAVINQ